MFEFHPDQWLEIVHNNPVILVLLGGLIGGVALTQTAKLFYLAFPAISGGAVSEARYNLSITMLSTVVTFAFTNWLWLGLISEHGTGLRHAVSLISAIASPYSYKTAKYLVAVRWPDFAAKWGDTKRP